MRRTGCFLLFLLLFQALLSAATLSGTILIATGGGLLIETHAGEKAVLLTKKTLWINGVGHRDLRRGMAVKVETDGVRGLPLARSVQIIPAYHADPAFEMNVTWPLDGTLQPVDCRTRKAFTYLHLPGAIHLSQDEDAEDALQKMAQNGKTLLFYGENRQSMEPFLALQRALDIGLKALVYPGGVEAWNRAGNVFAAEPDPAAWPENLIILDVRSSEERAAGDLPAGRWIDVKTMAWQAFSNPSGMPPILLYGEDAGDPRPSEAAEKILRWRYGKEISPDGPVALLEGGFNAWQARKLPVIRGEEISPFTGMSKKAPGTIEPKAFKRLLAGQGDDTVVIDLRFPKASPHPGILQIPLEEWGRRFEAIPKGKPVVLFCFSGKRARIGYTLLHDLGCNVRYLPAQPLF